MNKIDLERRRRENLRKLDQSCRDDRHINCVRFSKGESIKHKLAKCIAGILASKGVPVEDIADFIERWVERVALLEGGLETCIKLKKTKDNQDFIQEARFRKDRCHQSKRTSVSSSGSSYELHGSGTVPKQRRADHWQFTLDKILEFETDSKVKKEGDNAITVRI